MASASESAANDEKLLYVVIQLRKVTSCGDFGTFRP